MGVGEGAAGGGGWGERAWKTGCKNGSPSLNKELTYLFTY